MSDFIITAKDVTKVYIMGEEEVHALRGISMNVKRGEYVSIMGPSGSGKSTFFKSSGKLRGQKRDLYDGGIRVPLIVRWPGKVKAGSTASYIGCFQDFLVTAAELAGADAPSGTDGISFVPALLGKEQKQHPYLYWEFYERGYSQAVRMGNYKGVRRSAGRPGRRQRFQF